MTLLDAFELMLASLTTVDASRRQINGCTAWQAQVAAAQSAMDAYLAAAGEDPDPDAAQVAGQETTTHRSWLGLCQQIIAALERQAALAAAAAGRWEAEAGQHRAAAESYRAAAAACNEERSPGCKAHFEALAAAEDAEAEHCESLAALARAWQSAATAAVVVGGQLARDEDQVHRPVGEAVQAAGRRRRSRSRQDLPPVKEGGEPAVSNTRTSKANGSSGRGQQVPPEDLWELLRAAVNQAAPGKNSKNGKPGKNSPQDTDDRTQTVLQPSGARLTWQAYHRLIAPLWWMGLVQAAAWAGWAAGGTARGQARELILTVAFAFAVFWTARRCWWARNADGTKGRARRVRTAKGVKVPPWALSRGFLGWCLAAGIGWAAAAAYTGPAAAAAQLTWLAGALILAAPHLHRRRYRTLPAAALPPPLLPEESERQAEDERLTKFRDWFCTKGALANAWLSDFGTVPDGFSFELALDEQSTGTREAVVQLRPGIAAKYDVPLEQVSVEQSRNRRSERRARLTILETVNAFERVQMWGGESTYDPATGAFDLGRYIDSTTVHWLLHVPRSGAAGGVIAGVVGAGKALAVDTRVPTPAGWTTMGELRDGDVVYDESGSPCTVTRAWPVRHDRPCYEIEFSDGSKIIADAEHRWLVETYWSRLSEGRARRRAETQAVMVDCTRGTCGGSFPSRKPAGTWACCPDCHQTSVVKRPGRSATPWNSQVGKRTRPRVVTTEEMIPSLWARGDRQANYSVRVAAALQGEDAWLPVPPYVLGAWLGDGKTTGGDFTSADPEIITEMERAGANVRLMKAPAAPGGVGQYYIRGMRPNLRRIGVLGDKHIPVRYLRASEDQRRELLAGLLDTDGSCTPTGNVEFFNTTERLARDVLHLVSTLGYKASINSKPALLYGKDCGTCWIVSFTPGDKVFRLPRKLARQTTRPRATAGHRYVVAIKPVDSVPVRCVTVDSPNHLYLAGETCIPTHNSGTAHCIACEAGQARLCAVCGAQRTCARCDMRRICAVWMGDPQMQPFGVWRGRADLMAWGPEGCVRMLLMARHAMRARAAYFGTMKWRDHLGRENTGKGWFDPTPQFPLIYVIIDEWPLIAGHPELGKAAIKLAGEIAKEGRKVGVALLFLTQIPDLSELGERAVREMLKAFNVIAHRTDALSKYMLGIEGNPNELPAGVHGLGFLNGLDRRPAATMRTKNIPEYLQPGQTGMDVRELAERISRDPIGYDRAVADAIGPLGYEGPLQVIGSDGAAILPLMDDGAPLIAAPGPAAGPVSLLRGPASLDAVGRVARAIEKAGPGGAELYDLMTDTNLDALQAQRAAAALVATGGATQNGDRFIAAGQEARP